MESFAARLTLLRHGLVVIMIGAAAAACTPGSGAPSSSGDTGASAAQTAGGFAGFVDIAVPAGARMDVERSLVLGARDNWIGRLSMNADRSPPASYDFFLREMPKHRWRELTTVRSETGVLTYSRDDRIATIQITKRTFGGSRIDVTVSPRGRPPASSSSMPSAPAGGGGSFPGQ